MFSNDLKDAMMLGFKFIFLIVLCNGTCSKKRTLQGEMLLVEVLWINIDFGTN
jgi:hypothetical protein